MVKLIIEDHWETRQEYIKLGNELAVLEKKQRMEKEKEELMRKVQEKMVSIPSPSTVAPMSDNIRNQQQSQNHLFENKFSKLQVEELRKGNIPQITFNLGKNIGIGFQNFRSNPVVTFHKGDSSK